jgi:hypothetical protein
MSKFKTVPMIASLLVALFLANGCSNTSPPASEEALNSKGASKSESFQDMISKSKAKNPGAPGYNSK